MTELIQILLINLATVALLETAKWLISLKRNNVTIADSLWGLGFIIIAWLTFFNGDGYLWRKVILTASVTLWGLPLSWHITKRGKGKGEDPRYTEWRKEYAEYKRTTSSFVPWLPKKDKLFSTVPARYTQFP